MKKTTIVLAALSAALMASLALASDHRGDGWDHDRDWCHGASPRCASAPEIDPGQAMGALALLGGTVAIIRGNRRKK